MSCATLAEPADHNPNETHRRMNLPTSRSDIASRRDIETLVRCFYEHAISDPINGKFFTEVAHLDLEAHLPKIANFWEQMLFQRSVFSDPRCLKMPVNTGLQVMSRHQASGIRFVAMSKVNVGRVSAAKPDVRLIAFDIRHVRLKALRFSALRFCNRLACG